MAERKYIKELEKDIMRKIDLIELFRCEPT